MMLHNKRRLLNKLARMANELGYDVARLSTTERQLDIELAEEFSNMVDRMRDFQRALAINIEVDGKGLS